MIRQWAMQHGGAHSGVSVAVLIMVTAFFLWTYWRVYNPKSRDHFENIGAFPLKETSHEQ